jgi:hypothetical protein
MDGHNDRQNKVAQLHDSNRQEGNVTTAEIHTVRDHTNSDHGSPVIAILDTSTGNTPNDNSPRTPFTPIQPLSDPKSNTGTPTRRTSPPRTPIPHISDEHQFPHCSSEVVCVSHNLPTTSTYQHDHPRGEYEGKNTVIRHVRSVDCDDGIIGVKRKQSPPPTQHPRGRPRLSSKTAEADTPPSSPPLQRDNVREDVTPNNSTFTFILHKTNIPSHTPPTKKGPSFASFDHGDHFHYIFSIKHPNNCSRTIANILDFLKIGLPGVAEANTTLQRVRSLSRFLHKTDIVYPHDFVPPGIKNTTFDLQSDMYLCKTEELSTGHTKQFSFTPEQLPPNYVWETLPINAYPENAKTMFPARQHTTSAQEFDKPFTDIQGRSFASSYLHSQPHPLPHIELHSPHISSEAGYMKFIYRTRWDFSINYTLHIKPSCITETSYTKFVVPYPSAKMISSDTSDGELPHTFQYLSTPHI